MYSIFWESRTGAIGNGEPMPIDLAMAWMQYLNSKNTTFNKGVAIKHWLVKI
jgi:hypothetical protein